MNGNSVEYMRTIYPGSFRPVIYNYEVCLLNSGSDLSKSVVFRLAEERKKRKTFFSHTDGWFRVQLFLLPSGVA